MLQYRCDRCRKLIDTDSENRFVLHLDLRKATCNENQEDPNDRDYLIEVDQILSNEELVQEDAEVSDPGCFRKTFDLCETCYSQYARNPLAVEAASTVGYTPN